MGAPRYPSGPRGPGVRMPQGIGNEFNGVSMNRRRFIAFDQMKHNAK